MRLRALWCLPSASPAAVFVAMNRPGAACSRRPDSHPQPEAATALRGPSAAGLRAAGLGAILMLGLSGCLFVENPPSKQLACDPALVGDWGLIEGPGILDSGAQPPPAEFGDDDERRLRIDAQCRAYPPPQYGLRQVDLQLFKADGHRYLGLKVTDSMALIRRKNSDDDRDHDAEINAAYPHAVSLMRYETGPQALTIDIGDEKKAEPIVAERNARAGVAAADAPDFLTGDRRQIRQLLREHPELYEKPDRSTLYRFKRIAPVAR
ncbi:MAG: hypothetical protein ACREP7_19215 [Lysobacter sp.]